MGQVSDARSKVLDALVQHSLELGEVRLSSGELSDYYVDAKRTTMRQECFGPIGEIMLDCFQEMGVSASAVGGLTLGADAIALAVSQAAHVRGLSLECFSVRKEPKDHGTMRNIEGVIESGARVFVVDDVVTKGKSTLRAIDALREERCEVVAVVALINREQGGMEKIRAEGLIVSEAFTARELLERKRDMIAVGSPS